MSNVFFIGRTDLVDFIPHGSVNQILVDATIIRLFGGFRSFFLFGNRDDVWVFGDNSHAQLGLGEVSEVQKRPQRLYCNYELLTCAETYTYAYNWEGLYYWGETNFGCSQYKGLCLDPKQLPQKGVSQLCAQNDRFYYIQHGDLYGNGFTHLLGVKTNVVSTSKPLLIMNKVVKISCSISHSLLLDENGYVFSWGNGKNGELGLQMAGYTFQTYCCTPTQIKQLERIQDIQCGNHYSLALNQQGIVYEWGNGLQSMTFEEALKIKEVRMPNQYSNIRKIHVAQSQAACVDQLGRLYQWNSKYPKPQLIKCGFRCEEFLCGDGIVLFIGNEQAYQVSEHFKQQVKEKVKKYKDYVELKNNKVRNVFYDENKRTKCLQELNQKVLEQQIKPIQPEDFLYSRLQRKQSLYVMQLKRRSTMMISELQTLGFQSEHKPRFSTIKFDLIKEQMKQGKLQLLKTDRDVKDNKNVQGSWEQFKLLSKNVNQTSQIKNRIPLHILNTKLSQAIEIDKVSDLILESERLNPLYIPLDNMAKIVKSQPQTQRESLHIQDSEQKEFIDDPDIMKYEYVKRIYNGYHEKLLMDNLMTKDQCFLPIKWKRLKDDTKLFQGRYNRMQQRLQREQRDAKKLTKITDIQHL
ncbi:unnamed protein product [Paramecium primaurelia]|uniref:Uncharacterized protein n=1 Tax=Paramecium primaurelia TaxID=5886 RepID=A0A8S1NG23_PARPR|nr:unnamed protein product [Paramecium primaurelia]